MYTLSLNTAFWLNWIVFVLVLLALLQGYARGFVRQLFDLVIFIVALVGAAYLGLRLGDLMPILSRRLEMFDHPIWGSFIHGMLNGVVWFVLLLIAITIGMELLLKPVVRMIRERNELRIIDRILGSVFGFLRTLLWFLVGMVFILSPLFTNGRAVLERSLLMPLVPLADTLQMEVMNGLGPVQIFTEDGFDQELVAKHAEAITDWLVENGVAEEFSTFIEKGLKNEVFTESDLEKAQTFIQENQVSEDELIDFLRGIGVDPEQIEKAREYFKFEN